MPVKGVFGDPDKGDGHGHGRAAAHADGDPFPIHGRGGIVVVGVDEHHLDPFLPEPQAPHGGILARVGAPGGVGIIGPEHDHFRMLQGIFQQVVLFGHTQAPEETIGMGGAPVPAFPAVRIVEDRRIANHVEKTVKGAHLVAHDAPVVVGGCHACERRRSIGFPDPVDLGPHHVQRLVPADSLVRRLAPILWVPGPVRVKIHPLHGISDPVL